MVFSATREAVLLLANDPIMSGRSIQSFRHLECQNPSIILDSIGIPRWLWKMGKWVSRRSWRSQNLIHIEEDKEASNEKSFTKQTPPSLNINWLINVCGGSFIIFFLVLNHSLYHNGFHWDTKCFNLRIIMFSWNISTFKTNHC